MKLKPILIATAITAAFAAVGCQEREAGGGAGADRPSSTAPGSTGGTPGGTPGSPPSGTPGGAGSTQPGGSSSGSSTTPGSGK